MIYDSTQIILFQYTIEKNTLYTPEFFYGQIMPVHFSSLRVLSNILDSCTL